MVKKYLIPIGIVCIALIVLIAILSWEGFKNTHLLTNERDKAIEDIIRADAILSNVKDAETGQSGYIITGKKSYLEPFKKAKSFFESDSYAQFLGNIDGNHLKDLIQKKFTEMQKVLNAYEENGRGAAVEIISNDTGKGLMDEIRLTMVAIQAKKQEEIVRIEKQIENSTTKLLKIILLGNLFAFGIISACFYSLFRDIQHRKKIENAFKELTSMQKTILDSAKQAIITLDFNGNIISFNKGAERLFGYPSSDILCSSVLNLYSDVNGKQLKDLSGEYKVTFSNCFDFLKFLSRREIVEDCVWNAKKKNGSTFEFQQVATSLKDSGGKVKGYLIVGNDVTEKKKWEREIVLAQEKAKSANQAKSIFLTNMSHDLRTPLNSIIGFSGILLKNKAQNLLPEQITYLKRVVENGRHLLNLINTILDLSKIEEGNVELDWSYVNLKELLNSLVKQLEGQVLDSQVKLIAEVPESLDVLQTDREKLTLILMNLIGNAIKFTREGFIRIKVLKDEDTNYPSSIQIIDTGKGIGPEHIQKIFDAFYQVDSGTDRQYGGSGLGLSITKELCKLLQYDLHVESQVGKGSIFTINLKNPSPVARNLNPVKLRSLQD